MTMIVRYRLWWFFLIAFVLAWGTWIPAFSLPHLPAVVPMVGLFAPAIAAVAVAGATNGRRGVREIFGRLAIWRFGGRWYALAGGLMPLAYLSIALVDVVVFDVPARSMWTSGPAYYFIVSFIWLLVVTSGEEIGWRGFALPLMLNGSTSRLYTASLFLGIMWGIWHAPVYLSGNGPMPYPVFLVLAVGLSLVYTALFVRSNGSLWPALLLHAGTDVGPRIVQIGAFGNADWLIVAGFAAAAGLAMLRTLPRREPSPLLP